MSGLWPQVQQLLGLPATSDGVLQQQQVQQQQLQVLVVV
jgi:hypothetical protein